MYVQSSEFTVKGVRILCYPLCSIQSFFSYQYLEDSAKVNLTNVTVSLGDTAISLYTLNLNSKLKVSSSGELFISRGRVGEGREDLLSIQNSKSQVLVNFSFSGGGHSLPGENWYSWQNEQKFCHANLWKPLHRR